MGIFTPALTQAPLEELRADAVKACGSALSKCNGTHILQVFRETGA
jgi:hypothetical protein